MKNKSDYDNEIIFFLWGAGIIGRRICNVCSIIGLRPIGIIDSSEDKWDTFINGVEVYPPSILTEYPASLIFVTSKYSSEIMKSLHTMGVNDCRIRCTRTIDDLFNINAVLEFAKKKILCSNQSVKEVVFCLDNGAALGGVEHWALMQKELVQKSGADPIYLLCDNGNTQIDMSEYDSEQLHGDGTSWFYIFAMHACKARLTIVINFPTSSIDAASALKRICKNVRIVAVVHNDELAYYSVYRKYESCIDECLVISSTIKEKLLETGFDTDKVCYMPWKISYVHEHNYHMTGDIVVGYAGRITKIQKRSDVLVRIIESVCRENPNVIFKIAGTGDFLDSFINKIKEAGIDSRVIYSGILSHDKMMQFWKSVDIAISCSDFEGHSISQTEAISAGAVSVVTDTSGMRDMIRDGVNGYICPIYDYKYIADKIIFLEQHRSVLKKMGKASVTVVSKMNEKYNEWEEKVLDYLS